MIDRMKTIEYTPGDHWRSERVLFEDEFGNRGYVIFPHKKESYTYGDEWEDAEVDIRSGYDGHADYTACAAEFALHLAHVAKTLDLAFAEEAAHVKGRQERQEAERELREQARRRAKQMRSEELAQFYMQMVRVQREGHRANAKGELHVTMLNREDGTTDIRASMYLIESNGNRWQFESYRVAKFEVKNGQRYEEVKLTPMSVLEKQAELEVAA